MFRSQHVEQFRANHPGIKILVHPECTMEVVDQADCVGSTGRIISEVESATPGTKWAIGTELHLVNRLKQEHPSRRFTSSRRWSACARRCIASILRTSAGRSSDWPPATRPTSSTSTRRSRTRRSRRCGACSRSSSAAVVLVGSWAPCVRHVFWPRLHVFWHGLHVFWHGLPTMPRGPSRNRAATDSEIRAATDSETEPRLSRSGNAGCHCPNMISCHSARLHQSTRHPHLSSSNARASINFCSPPRSSAAAGGIARGGACETSSRWRLVAPARCDRLPQRCG